MINYSVLMSVYYKDRKDYLCLSIDSILNQTHKPDQFVIVFDGPVSDELEGTVQEYSKRAPGLFTIVKLEKNCGLPTALNEGLKVCRNNLVARMDSDDYSLPQRCERQIVEFEKRPDLALIGTDTQYFTRTIEDVSPTVHAHPYTEGEIIKELRRNSPFGHPTVMFKKDVVDACGGYDPILTRSQDYDLFSKIIYNGHAACNLPEVLLYYRTGENMMRRNKSWESCKARIIIQKRIFKRKQCSLWDVIYIDLAMIVSMILPVSAYERIYKIIKKG
jgi:glycosyltransferase involved in cell wall biosynthesis